jgi:hypothetical protein
MMSGDSSITVRSSSPSRVACSQRASAVRASGAIGPRAPQSAQHALQSPSGSAIGRVLWALQKGQGSSVSSMTAGAVWVRCLDQWRRDRACIARARPSSVIGYMRSPMIWPRMPIDWR